MHNKNYQNNNAKINNINIIKSSNNKSTLHNNDKIIIKLRKKKLNMAKQIKEEMLL